MKILITDNEPHLRQSLKELLLAFCANITVIEEADGVKTGIEKIKSFQPDIVFLDVEMEDGTGFDLLKQLPEHNFQLVFITAHNKYAIDAFKFSAIDYLLKPVDPVALQASVEKAGKNIRNKDLHNQVQVLMQQLSGINHERRIVLKDLEKIYFIKVADILYCEAAGTYTKFFIQNSDPLLVSKNLKEYESILEPLGFVRTHHSFLVNPDKINAFDKTDGGTLILEGNHMVPISQRKKDFVLALLEQRR
ncbi:MAG: LytTR family DNA-binding domain-containing protein [Ferruginibacter sp.]